MKGAALLAAASWSKTTCVRQNEYRAVVIKNYWDMRNASWKNESWEVPDAAMYCLRCKAAMIQPIVLLQWNPLLTCCTFFRARKITYHCHCGPRQNRVALKSSFIAGTFNQNLPRPGQTLAVTWGGAHCTWSRTPGSPHSSSEQTWLPPPSVPVQERSSRIFASAQDKSLQSKCFWAWLQYQVDHLFLGLSVVCSQYCAQQHVS